MTEIEAICLGHLGMGRSDIEDSRPGDLFTKIIWNKKRERDREVAAWLRMRRLAFILVNIQLDKKNKIRKESDIFPVLDDELNKDVIFEINPEQIEKLVIWEQI